MRQYFGPNQTARRASLRNYLLVVLLAVTFFGGWHVGTRSQQAAIVSGSTTVTNTGSVSSVYSAAPDFDLFWDLWEQVKKEYVGQPVDEAQLFYGAMGGMVQALGDPYSQFFDPETAAAFDEELSGSFSGIGVEIGIKNDLLVVIAPIADSPGDQAGLRPGDKILAIGGIETFGMPLAEAVSLIRGEEGTPVVLTILGDGAEIPREISVPRRKIEETGLRWEYLGGDILHIKLSSFDQDSENLMNKLIREINGGRAVRGIVLDLRNNPGGYLDMAIEIASEWVEQGIVVRERDFAGEERQHHARGRARLSAYKTIVLVNEGSASASEIVAGALQDYALATLVGKTTYGKGSVQKYESLEDGSAFRLTVAKWYTPKERAIDEVGIQPDVDVELTPEDFNADRDPQLEKALELLAQ
jgi:carboxyl-terminal processing protease